MLPAKGVQPMKIAAGLALALFLAVSLPLVAKPKPVYDHVGILDFRKTSDFTYHYQSSDGSSYSSYCDVSGVDVSCAEGSGYNYFIKRPGKRDIFLGSLWISSDIHDVLIGASKGDEIHFRFATTEKSKVDLTCIPYDVLDKHGKVKDQKEACYYRFQDPD